MANLTYAPWVEATARVVREDRRAVIAFARAASAAWWANPSPVDGWTNRDLLAHLAGGNDQLLQTLLLAATGRTALNPAALDPDTDAENARRIDERRSWPISDLIAELDRDGAEIQDLLAALSVEDEGRRFEDFPITLGEFLRIIHHERHDNEHLQQLLAAAD